MRSTRFPSQAVCFRYICAMARRSQLPTVTAQKIKDILSDTIDTVDRVEANKGQVMCLFVLVDGTTKVSEDTLHRFHVVWERLLEINPTAMFNKLTIQEGFKLYDKSLGWQMRRFWWDQNLGGGGCARPNVHAGAFAHACIHIPMHMRMHMNTHAHMYAFNITIVSLG